MSPVLEGIRVLDLSQMLAGPLTAMYLADQGADVVKIESPEGDITRSIYATSSLGPNNTFFLAMNRNKRSIVLNLKRPEARPILQRLVVRSDVLIENTRPRTAKRLGLDYETLARINPRLVYASLTGFGDGGPLADRPAYDLIIQARAGIMGLHHLPDGFPLSAPVNVADCSAPMLLAYGIMLALFARERSGRGQRVSTSLLSCAIAMQAPHMTRVDDDPAPLNRGPQAVYSPYRCQDGDWLIIVVLSDREWPRLCAALGLPHLAGDPAFATASGRGEHSTELAEIFMGVFATKPRDEWLRVLEAADVPCAPINSREDLLKESQAINNRMIVPFQHPVAGRGVSMGIPLQLSATPGALRRPAPSLGEHTEEVLAEIGLSPEERAHLRDIGIIPATSSPARKD
ncbi:MAG: CoA transferase [Chloroflexi bacterium]|nr:CoA transferase [Chloroflexota bacterium]